MPVQGTPLTPDLLHLTDAPSTRAAVVPPVAEAAQGVSGASCPGFQQTPAALQGWDHCSSHAFAARARFGDGVVVAPSPAALIPS